MIFLRSTRKLSPKFYQIRIIFVFVFLLIRILCVCFLFLTGNTSSTGSMTSEFVRQELRAVVGARTQQRVPNNLQSNLSGQVTQDELEALGLPFEMSSAGKFRRRNCKDSKFKDRKSTINFQRKCELNGIFSTTNRDFIRYTI